MVSRGFNEGNIPATGAALGTATLSGTANPLVAGSAGGGSAAAAPADQLATPSAPAVPPQPETDGNQRDVETGSGGGLMSMLPAVPAW
jgi:hypothetical protein